MLHNRAWVLRTCGRSNRIKGGRAAGHRAKEFDWREVLKGIKVEREHTLSNRLACEIALDHLVESKDYYKYLAKMEQRFERKRRHK